MAGVDCILGYRGAGKSTLARALCASDKRLVVCDTIGEFARKGFMPRCDGPALVAAIESGEPFRLAFEPEDAAQMDWLERLVASEWNITLLVDEIDWWYGERANQLGPGMQAIVKTGRHYGQRLVVASRIAAKMPIEIRSEGTLWVFPVRHVGTRRMIRDCTETGFDPMTLQVLEGHGERVTRTEVARITGCTVQIFEFHTVTGKLYPARSRVVETPEEVPDTVTEAETPTEQTPNIS